ncbi:hypothetical protein E2C01_025021 [Portunus trituberculatus]|uniref:Uncharacterized protein n=1 Tax=Portunus trituberculatus TaxID=210409 RepID=A0A5B7EGQ9_PORTR|nr:hypothetical protein [Portunus trituberculatus]
MGGIDMSLALAPQTRYVLSASLGGGASKNVLKHHKERAKLDHMARLAKIEELTKGGIKTVPD